MKRLVFYMCVVFFILAAMNVFAESAYTDRDELIDMAEFVTDTHSLQKWNVTIKETVRQDQLPQLLTKLHNNYSVTTDENEKRIKIIAKYPQKKDELNEWYTVVIPKTNNQQIELSAVIEGSVWNESVKRTYQLRISEMENFFTDAKQKFSWLTFTDNDKISSNVLLEKVVDNWQIENTRLQTDNIQNKKILYGYTPVWQEYIRVQKSTFNIQLAVVSDNNGATTYTLGTPILINEY